MVVLCIIPARHFAVVPAREIHGCVACALWCTATVGSAIHAVFVVQLLHGIVIVTFLFCYLVVLFNTWYQVPGSIRCRLRKITWYTGLTKFVLVKRCGAVRWGVWCGVERYCAIIFFAVNAIAIHEVILSR